MAKKKSKKSSKKKAKGQSQSPKSAESASQASTANAAGSTTKGKPSKAPPPSAATATEEAAPTVRPLPWFKHTEGLGGVLETGVTFGALLLALVLGVFEAETAYTGLQSLSGWMLGLTGLALGYATWTEKQRGDAAPLWPRALSLLLGILALMAAVGRDTGLHGAPFELARTHMAGFPSELPFIMMAASAAALARKKGNAVARLLLVGSTLWASFVLLWPVYELGESRVPLMKALDALSAEDGGLVMAGVCHALLAFQVACAWWLLWDGPDGPPRPAVAGTVQSGHLVVVLIHLLAAVSGGGDASWLIAALLFVMGTATAQFLGRYQALDEAGLERFHAPSLKVVDILIPTVVLGLYWLLKTHAMGPSNTDENIYFYMTHDLAVNGRWPYADFFFAHPPMHLVVPAAIYKIFGYSMFTAKMVSALAGAIAGLAVWLIGRHHLGRFAAAAAMVGFLFAAETLKASTNMTGINLTVMWLMLGAWQSLKGNPLRAGVSFGLAAMTGLYSSAAICALLLLGVFRKDPPRTPLTERFWVRQLGAALVVFLGLHFIFSSMGGDSYSQGVFEYHGQKRLQDPDMVELTGLGSLLHNLGVMMDGAPFTKEVSYHAHLWITFFTAPLLGLWVYFTTHQGQQKPGRFFDPRRLWEDGAHGIAGIIWLVALALFIQYAMFRELYSFYFTLIYPVLALLIGYTLEHSVRLGASSLEPEAGRSRLVGAVVVLFAFGMWLPWSADTVKIFNEHSVLAGRMNGSASGSVHIVKGDDGRLNVKLDRRFKVRAAKVAPSDVAIGIRHGVDGSETMLGGLAKNRGEHFFPIKAALKQPAVGDTVFLRWSGAPNRPFAQAMLREGQLGKVNEYTWREAPVMTGLSGVVQELFWSDTRTKGEQEPGYRYYLWTKKRMFESLPRVAEYVRENTTADETITGGSTMTPIVALEAGRRLAADEVDTNSKRFSSGILDEGDFWRRICADNVRLILSIQRSYFSGSRMRKLQTVRKHFKLDRVFEDDHLTYGRKFRITFYKRTSDAPCQWEDGAGTTKAAKTKAGSSSRRRKQ